MTWAVCIRLCSLGSVTDWSIFQTGTTYIMITESLLGIVICTVLNRCLLYKYVKKGIEEFFKWHFRWCYGSPSEGICQKEGSGLNILFLWYLKDNKVRWIGSQESKLDQRSFKNHHYPRTWHLGPQEQMKSKGTVQSKKKNEVKTSRSSNI